jgi:hypothetical protein
MKEATYTGNKEPVVGEPKLLAAVSLVMGSKHAGVYAVRKGDDTVHGDVEMLLQPSLEIA